MGRVPKGGGLLNAWALVPRDLLDFSLNLLLGEGLNKIIVASGIETAF